MQLLPFRHLWGLEHVPLDESIPSIAVSGYAGIEAEMPAGAGQEELRALLVAHDLRFIPLIQLEAATPEEQLEALRRELDTASSVYGSRLVTAHTGHDAWPLPTAIDFYREVVEIEAELGVRVAHETHRGRTFFTPWTTAAVLAEIPDLGLCCDFSHWVVVSERLLDDQGPAIDLAASRALHLHARIGYDQSPQVADPTAPEVDPQREVFEEWWTAIWSKQLAAGVETTSFTAEYGPPPYLNAAFGSPEANALPGLIDRETRRIQSLYAAWELGAAARLAKQGGADA